MKLTSKREELIEAIKASRANLPPDKKLELYDDLPPEVEADCIIYSERCVAVIICITALVALAIIFPIIF